MNNWHICKILKMKMILHKIKKNLVNIKVKKIKMTIINNSNNRVNNKDRNKNKYRNQVVP
jgi:hypothetical protein